MAGFKVTGDFNRLAATIRRFQKTASPQAQRALLERIARDYLDEVRRRFETATDPNGVPWAPLADGSGRKPLTVTGALSRSFSARVEGNGRAIIGSSAPYSGFHQTGTAHMPARMMVPDSVASAGSASSSGKALRALMRNKQRAARAAARVQRLAGKKAARAARALTPRRRGRSAARTRLGPGPAHFAYSRGFDLLAWLRRIGRRFMRRAMRDVLPG